MDQLNSSLLGELSATEKYLLETQELMEIRGKVAYR
jgi:hypothetical protein